jgi:hypothetical protein
MQTGIDLYIILTISLRVSRWDRYNAFLNRELVGRSEVKLREYT